MSTYSDAVSYGDAMGFGHGLETFAARLRSQKTVFLLREFGAGLDYTYNWYAHGPYSPSLTRELFNPPKAQEGRPRVLQPAEMQMVNSLRNFLGEDLYSLEELELLSSLVFLIRFGPGGGLDSKKKLGSVERANG